MVITLGSQIEWQEKKLEYLRYEYPLKQDDLVLDIGSYKREFAERIHMLYGCMVECFDALDNRAAWVKDGTLKMGGQYYYTSMFDNGELGEVKEYKCVDITPFVKQEVVLCKINIEGGEYTLLPYLMPYMKNIRFLQVQFHLIDGINCQTLYEDIARKLSDSHKIMWRYPFVWESWERK